MVAKIFYSKDSPSKSIAEDFAEELESRKVETELVDADSPSGSDQSQLYDVLSRPALVLVRDDGSVVERWQHQLPPAGDVSYLAHE